MVEISVQRDVLEVRIVGWSKLWCLKSRLEAPLRCVRGIRQDGELPQGYWLRWPGTSIPGLVKAGSFWNGPHGAFWDVRRRRDQVVVIELCGWKYDKLVVEVENPTATIEQVRAAIEGSR